MKEIDAKPEGADPINNKDFVAETPNEQHRNTFGQHANSAFFTGGYNLKQSVDRTNGIGRIRRHQLRRSQGIQEGPRGCENTRGIMGSRRCGEGQEGEGRNGCRCTTRSREIGSPPGGNKKEDETTRRKGEQSKKGIGHTNKWCKPKLKTK